MEGGSNLLQGTDTIAAATSFVLNGNCAGTGRVFRLDRLDVLVFIDGVLSE
jgi:hypothetical protein